MTVASGDLVERGDRVGGVGKIGEAVDVVVWRELVVEEQRPRRRQGVVGEPAVTEAAKSATSPRTMQYCFVRGHTG